MQDEDWQPVLPPGVLLETRVSWEQRRGSSGRGLEPQLRLPGERWARAGKRDETAEKVSSLGKDWHKFCLKCERCNKTLTPGGHAEHDGKPFCHKPCYATLFGPK
ncbi:PREDICTED: cysteine-rich protein 2-like, partial [Fulmarus glacialis]|uniref:cysteine-rich protein 2-like n=1 Tax=Fulmarus glacialis TaxID=30455 RepID=UPI00051B4CCB